MSGYALCTTIRSGSPWLAALLASTGQVGRPAEFFSTKFQKRVVSPDYPETVRAQVAYALEHGRTPNGIYGFKIDPMQFDGLSARVAWTACFPDLRSVHFARRDRLGQAISRVRANQTLQWRSTLPAGAAPRYDGDAILAAMRETLAQDARRAPFFARTGIAPLRIVGVEGWSRPRPSASPWRSSAARSARNGGSASSRSTARRTRSTRRRVG